MAEQTDHPLGSSGPTADAKAAAALSDRPTVLGDFELRREIGRGGMGTVFEAFQSSLRRVVALKILSGSVGATPAAVQRFQREAQAAAKLHHTNIIPIFAQGEFSGVHYYAMELVEGPTLAELIAKTGANVETETAPLGLEETVALPRSNTIGDSSAQLVTDSKSDAITGSSSVSGTALGPTDNSSGRNEGLWATFRGLPKSTEQFAGIAEFIAGVADGLAFAHQRGIVHRDIKPHNLLFGGDDRLRISDFGLARLSEQPGVTMTGELLGSPLYMSPEQITEGPSKVDHRTDIYSLGVTLYEWLTLRPPFVGESREQVISRIMHFDPSPPRSRNPGIPVDLETICLKAMERDRNRRYQSAAEMRDDLRRFVSQSPIRARRAGLWLRAARFAQRHPIASLGVAALMVAAWLSIALLSKRSEVATQRATIISQQATVNAREEDFGKFLDALSSVSPEARFIIQSAGKAAPIAQGLVETGQKLAPTAVADLTTAANPAPESMTPGIVQRVPLDYFDGLELDLAPADGTERSQAIAALLRQATAAKAESPKLAMQLTQECVKLAPNDYEARRLRAALAGHLGEYEMMFEDAEALVRLRSSDASAYVWRGLAFLLLNRTEESLADLSKSVEMDPTSAWSRTILGLAQLRASQAEEAITTLSRVIEENPDQLVALLARAIAHATRGDLVSAIADVSRGVALEPKNAEWMAIRGDFHSAKGDYTAAVSDFEQAAALGGSNPDIAKRQAVAILRKLGLRQSNTEGQDSPKESESEKEAGVSEKKTVDPQATDWLERYLWPESGRRRTDGASNRSANPPSSAPQFPFGSFRG